MKPRKLPSGSWIVQVQVDGVRKSFTAKSKTEAVRRAAEFKLTATAPLCAPLGTMIDNYISSKRNVLSPSTIDHYEQMRRLYFSRLMDKPVNEITDHIMQTEINLMSADHSPKTVCNAFGLISATLKSFGMSFSVTLPKSRKTEYAVPTTEQVYDLINHSGDNMKTAIMLAAFCGLRRGEIAALESSDIQGNIIHVRSALVYDSDRQVVEKSPKTYSSDRFVSAPDFVLERIKDKKGKVCPLSLNSITRRFVEVRDLLGLSCRFHDLRHYYASALHAIGVKDQYIMKFGGWKSDHVLKSVYRGTLDDFEADAADRSRQYFEESANEMQMKHRKPS